MLLGADPEFIVLDYNNNPVNAIKCLKNNKTNPILQNKFYFFHDNVLAEFNFPPAPSEDIFVKHIKYGLESIQKLICPYKISFKLQLNFMNRIIKMQTSSRLVAIPISMHIV